MYAGPVEFSLSYCSGVLDLVNNLPNAWQEAYLADLSVLLETFSDTTVSFRLVDIAELYGSSATARDELLANFEGVEREWPSLDPVVRTKRRTSAAHNLVLAGVVDLHNLAPVELEQRIDQSAMLCEALDRLRLRREFNKLSTRIQLVNVRGPRPAIHVGSCDTSANHFTMGTGVVLVTHDRTLQEIVTGPRSSWNGVEQFAAPVEISRGFRGLSSGYWSAR